MPPNQPPVKGRAAIESWYKAAVARADTMGFQVGTFGTSAAGAASAAGNQFKYALALKRVTTNGLIQYDIWNSDQLSQA